MVNIYTEDEMYLVTAFTSEKEINISWTNILICTAPKMLSNTQMTKREHFDELLNITASNYYLGLQQEDTYAGCATFSLQYFTTLASELFKRIDKAS